MKNKKGLISFMFLFCWFLFTAESPGSTVQVKINGMSSVVDIEDLINRDVREYTDSDVKRLCVEITERYHKRGYTAFYIKQAVLHKDGTLELFFNESLVTEIVVSGALFRSDEISLSIYIKNNIFNENVLRENISSAKKQFNLKSIHADIKRTVDGQIALHVDVTERKDEISLVVYSSPVYGVMPGFKYAVNYGIYHAGTSFYSSFNQNDASNTHASVFLRRDINPEKSCIKLIADYSQRQEYLFKDDSQVYRQKSVTPKAGICLTSGAAGADFFLTGTFDDLNNYPGMKDGVTFSGIEINLHYDDSQFRIDYSDVTSCEIDFFSGWDIYKNRPSFRVISPYMFNVSLYPGFFISFNGNISYVSGNERLYEFYIFDENFSCRRDDFTFSSWRTVTGLDFFYEALKRTLYVAPSVKWGLYEKNKILTNVYAAGFRILYHAETVKFELSYLYDIDMKFKDGNFLFSAAGYL